MNSRGSSSVFWYQSQLPTAKATRVPEVFHRLRAACRHSRGYVYGVNLMGVTGERADLGEAAEALARRLKAATDLPVLMGFGVSGPEQAEALAAVADGVIVGTAIVRRILAGGSGVIVPSRTGGYPLSV